MLVSEWKILQVRVMLNAVKHLHRTVVDYTTVQ
jgi:hypothetical protein